MFTNISILTQQPRWLLLSVFLILWSWTSGLKRDGKKAPGLGVEARVPQFQTRQQGIFAPCVALCATQANEAIGCGDTLQLACACHSAQFMPDAVNCFTANCTAEEKTEGQAQLMVACKQVGTSVSLPTGVPSTTTSITSGVSDVPSESRTLLSDNHCRIGVPPISSPGSSSPGSSTEATITVTVTATLSPLPSSSLSSNTASASPSGTTSNPGVTTTVTVPPSPTTHPETTVLQTSTLSTLPTGGGAVDGVGNGASALSGTPAEVACAVFAVLVGALSVL
ncbi:hypothetical protein C8Q74DRAFT_188950 [Fomes fomentarius]|nr:hypothetical protein C8Q74DRAFT_188950 [Fomes fomentarius]